MTNIKKLRNNIGLTQEEMAKNLGCGQTAVSQWETGESMPRTYLLPKIAKVLGCTIDDLFKTEKNTG